MFGIQKLKHAVQIKQYEEEMEIKKMSKTAYTFHDFNLCVKAFQSLQINSKQEQIEILRFRQRIYERHLMKNTFRTMFKIKKELKKENEVIEMH